MKGKTLEAPKLEAKERNPIGTKTESRTVPNGNLKKIRRESESSEWGVVALVVMEMAERIIMELSRVRGESESNRRVKKKKANYGREVYVLEKASA